jgi:hypothetical protein
MPPTTQYPGTKYGAASQTDNLYTQQGQPMPYVPYRGQ